MANGSTPLCPANEHWDEAIGCCVPDGMEELEALSSQIAYSAVRRTLTRNAEEDREKRLRKTIQILKATLKKLTTDLPRGKSTTQF